MRLNLLTSWFGRSRDTIGEAVRPNFKIVSTIRHQALTVVVSSCVTPSRLGGKSHKPQGLSVVQMVCGLGKAKSVCISLEVSRVGEVASCIWKAVGAVCDAVILQYDLGLFDMSPEYVPELNGVMRMLHEMMTAQVRRIDVPP